MMRRSRNQYPGNRSYPPRFIGHNISVKYLFIQIVHDAPIKNSKLHHKCTSTADNP